MAGRFHLGPGSREFPAMAWALFIGFLRISLRFTNSHRLFLRGMVPSTFIWFLFPKDGVMGGEEMLEIPL